MIPLYWNSNKDKKLIREAKLLAIPMHGQVKLSTEGYRTRDGHFIEWFGRMLESPTVVVSRPDPLPFHLLSVSKRKNLAFNTSDVSTPTLRIPNFRNRRLWWLDSIDDYPKEVYASSRPLITWNPFLGRSKLLKGNERTIHFDILDDWTNHFAFAEMKTVVESAYKSIFEVASSVTVNSEATLEMAQRYGRNDAILMTNGCDPEKFSSISTAKGALTVGYVGKIGKRLDLQAILNSARANPTVKFVFAGPFLDREYFAPMNEQMNIELLGDVHYSKVPELLKTFDIGWVPHLLADGEVGGDVIKTYEYRAAGLPVLTTPVLGAGDRGLSQVLVMDAEHHGNQIAAWNATGPRVERVKEIIPPNHTWAEKSKTILGLLGLSATGIESN